MESRTIVLHDGQRLSLERHGDLWVSPDGTYYSIYPSGEVAGYVNGQWINVGRAEPTFTGVSPQFDSGSFSHDDQDDMDITIIPSKSAAVEDGSVVGKNCPYCQTPFVSDVGVIVCPSCGIPHHVDCWNENGGCTTFGCERGPQHVPGQEYTIPSTGMPPYVGAPGTGLPFCPFCDSRLPPNAAFCPNCHNVIPVGQYTFRHTCREASTALFLALFGFFCVGIGFLLEMFALAYGYRALSIIRRNPMLTGEGRAWAAIIIAWTVLALYALTILGPC